MQRPGRRQPIHLKHDKGSNVERGLIVNIQLKQGKQKEKHYFGLSSRTAFFNFTHFGYFIIIQAELSMAMLEKN